MANGNILAQRALTQKEVDGLTWGNRMGGPTINDIRYWHHQMARLLAEGSSVQAVANTIGKSYNRVWVISKDPTMMELIAEYQAQHEKKHQNAFDEIVTKHEEATKIIVDIKTMGLSQLRDQLEEVDAGVREPFPARTLLAIIDSMGDRSGHGKVQTNINATVAMDAKLELATIRSNTVRIAQQQLAQQNVIDLKSSGSCFLPPAEPAQAVQPIPSPGPRLRRI